MTMYIASNVLECEIHKRLKVISVCLHIKFSYLVNKIVQLSI